MYKIALIALILFLFTPSALAHLTDEDDIVKVVITDTGFEPDFVHILSGGKIVRSGGKELAHQLEEKGYDWLVKGEKNG